MPFCGYKNFALVGVPAVRDFDNGYEQYLIMNLINNAVVADAVTKKLGMSDELFIAVRSRVQSE